MARCYLHLGSYFSMSDNIGVEEAGRQDRQVRSEVEIKLRQLEITTAMSSNTIVAALVKHA